MSTTVNKNSKNAEILKAYPQIETGKTVLIAKEATKNPDYVTLFFAQKTKVATQATAAQKLLLGWGEGVRILRCIHNSKTEIAESIELGQVLPLDILVTEKNYPAYEGQQAKIYPESHPAAGTQVERNGGFIYEHSELVPVGNGGFIRMEEDEMVAAAAHAPESSKITEKDFQTV